MSVYRPSPQKVIRLDPSPIVALLRTDAPGTLVSTIMYAGFLGVALVFEVWVRSQPQTVAPETIHLLGSAYGQLGLALLLSCLAARPLAQVWTLPLRLRRELGVLGFIFSVLHTLNTLPFAPRSLSALHERPLHDQIGLWLGVVALLGLLPLALTSNAWSVYRLGNAWVALQRLSSLIVLLAGLHALLTDGRFGLFGSSPSLLGFGLLMVTTMIYAVRMRRKRKPVPARDTHTNWDGHAIHPTEHRNTRATEDGTPTPLAPNTATISPETQAQAVQVKRIRFDRSSFNPVTHDDDPDDDPDDPPPIRHALKQSSRNSLEQNLIDHLGLLDEIEQHVPDARKLSVLYRRTDQERVLRCSLAVNFDPKADGWTALEIANRFLRIVRFVASQQLLLQRLEVRIYQERFKEGASQRFERTFSFDLPSLDNASTPQSDDPER
jgi:DMSO/TMAO reductase YedYZ heme-binding membrane subunit